VRLRSFLALLAGYGALRLGELRRSRRHARRLSERGIPRRRDDAFPWMVAAHLVPFTLAPVEAALRPRRLPGLAGVAAAALVVAGAVRLWVMRTLGEAWNVRIHGGPSMPIALGGPYRFVRHPNYAAVVLELAALPLVGGAPASAALASALNTLALRRRIRDEEAVLETVPAWREAMRDRPRLLPLPAALRR
jgi:methyltransferase